MGVFLPCSRSCFASLLLLLLTLAPRTYSQASSATAQLSTVWSSGDDWVNFSYYFMAKAIPLYRSVPGGDGLSFAAMLYRTKDPDDCTYPCEQPYNYYFAICILPPYSLYQYIDGVDILVVWSANRGRPVQSGSTLNFTADGDLILLDSNGTLVWSTNTSGQSVIGMNITESGNLVLFNQKNLPVWQSFDHPTDTMLPRQPLMEGMELTPNISNTNYTASNQFYLAANLNGLQASASSIQDLIYYQSRLFFADSKYNKSIYIALVNGSLSMFPTSFLPPGSYGNNRIDLPLARSLQYMRFESDGHLRLYEWDRATSRGHSCKTSYH